MSYQIQIQATFMPAPAPAPAPVVPGTNHLTLAVLHPLIHSILISWSSGCDYMVYKCAPTPATPYWHWKYYLATGTTKDDLPDIRVARPLYIWNSGSGNYRAIDAISVDLN
jgi:hypothetical protein